MAQLNFARREITTQIVYYGARDAGVSTNVEQLAAALLPSRRTEVMSLTPPGSDLVAPCFDVAVDHHTARDFPLRTTIYGIPGGVFHPGLRRQILADVDGIVFVADARHDQEHANIESLLELERGLRERNLELTDLPMVLQVNHTDSPDARPVQSVVLDLNPYGFPVHHATASVGVGVTETLDTLMGLVALRVSAKLSGQPSGLRLVAIQDATPMPLAERLQQHLASANVEEVRLASEADPKKRFADLPTAHNARVRYQSPHLRGTRPTLLLDARLEGEDIVLDLIHERINGGDPQRIEVLVENRPADMDRLPQPQTLLSTAGDITASLPDVIAFPKPPQRDMPASMYGVIGLISGVFLGFLLGVILFYQG